MAADIFDLFFDNVSAEFCVSSLGVVKNQIKYIWERYCGLQTPIKEPYACFLIFFYRSICVLRCFFRRHLYLLLYHLKVYPTYRQQEIHSPDHQRLVRSF